MTKVKNFLIKNLSENGLENTTDHELSAAHAYKVFKFRDEIAEAFKKQEDKRQKLIKDCLGDGQEFNKRLKELKELKKPTKEQKKELEELDAKFDKYATLYSELLNDESELDIKTIPFEEYHLLSRENRRTETRVFVGEDENGQPKYETRFIDFFAVFRSALKDILWEEPKDDKK